jgi:hypothetical protein
MLSRPLCAVHPYNWVLPAPVLMPVWCLMTASGVNGEAAGVGPSLRSLGGNEMIQQTPAVRAFAGVAEAALSLGHRTYSGTVAGADRIDESVESYTSTSAAALALGHRTYSGTIAATERTP